MNRLVQAQAAFRQRHFEHSITILEDLLQQSPELAEAWLGLGLSLICASSTPHFNPKEDDDPDARASDGLRALRRALELDPTDPRAVVAISTTLQGLGQIDEAIKLLQFSAISVPVVLQPIVHLCLAELHACTGDHTAIRAELEVLSRLPLEQPLQRFSLHFEVRDADGLARAVEETQSWSETPNQPPEQLELWLEQARIGRGMLAELLKQPSLAIHLYRQCLSHQHWQPYEALARLLHAQGQLQDAQKMISAALDISPKIPEVIVTMAAISPTAQHSLRLAQIGRFSGCSQTLRKRALQLLNELD